MAERPRNVLFLCTHDSARSVLAEVLLGQIGRGRFNAYSAGSHRSGRVNPFALELLEKNRLSLPLEKLDRLALKRKLDELGRLRERGE